MWGCRLPFRCNGKRKAATKLLHVSLKSFFIPDNLAVLREVDVVCTTLGNSGDHKIKDSGCPFAYLVVDEAANAREPDVLYAIVNA
jgi:superfamily I DNA and/or RNA helicase